VFSVSSVAAAFRFIVILLPDPAYITEYIEEPFDTVRIVGDSNLTQQEKLTIKIIHVLFDK